MSDQEWERARGDHQRGRRYHQEHESETYVLARQQLHRNSNVNGSTTPAREEGALSGIKGVGILVAILLVIWQVYGFFSNRQTAQKASAYAANVETLRAGPIYKAALASGERDSTALLQVTARLVDFFATEPSASDPRQIVKAACGRLLPVCDPLIADYRQVVGAASVKAAESYRFHCRRPEPDATCERAPDELKALREADS